MFSYPTLISFYVILLSSFIRYTVSEEECGFEKYKLKTFEKLEEEGEKSLRFLQAQPYEQIRILIDYTTLDGLNTISDELKSNVKKVVEGAKSVIESIIQLKRLTKKIRISKCNKYISIAEDIQTVGVEADLIIFPFVDTEMQGATKAFASTCVISSRNSRPVAGFIGFTKNLNSDKINWLDYYTNIAVHELTHVLGFNSDLFDAFVDENDNAIPINKTLQEIEVDGVKRKIIVSPKALEAARKHFNCPELRGIELENQGGLGTIGSHWESRIMLTEFMVGFTYDEATLSDITLAFLEDSGWYKTNYYTGGLFRYGKNAGCSFINDKCIINEKVNFNNEFCNNKNAPFCTAGRLNKGFCYINNYPSNIDPSYRYFKALNKGGLSFTDFCPVSGVPPNEDSFLPWNCMTGIKGQYPSDFEESISINSGCFMSSLINKENESKYLPSTKAICYEYQCNYVSYKYNVTIGNNSFECPTKGGFIEVEDYAGVFECAPFYLICTSETRCNGLVDCVMKKALQVYNIPSDLYTNDDIKLTPEGKDSDTNDTNNTNNTNDTNDTNDINDTNDKEPKQPSSSSYISFINKFLIFAFLFILF